MKVKFIYYQIRAIFALIFTLPFLVLYGIFYTIFLTVFIIFIPLLISLVCFDTKENFKTDIKNIFKESAIFQLNYKPTLNLKIWPGK